MHLFGSKTPGLSQGFDFTAVLLLAVVVFVGAALFELSRSLPGAEHGLFLYERACPIYHQG
jgi:hypothetical protein